MISPYNINSYKKKSSKRKPTENHSKNEKSKNIVLKGGNPNDVHTSGKELLEQAFL